MSGINSVALEFDYQQTIENLRRLYTQIVGVLSNERICFQTRCSFDRAEL